jgi:rod shape determining protein RodA
MESLGSFSPNQSISAKLLEINWGFVFLLCIIASIGLGMLMSVRGGDIDPWASRQAIRFSIGLVVLIGVALVDIRVWMGLAYPAYFLALILLVAVELIGSVGMGAQRWIDLGVMQLQPSEVMKIALVLALARYFHGISLHQVSRPFYLVAPILLIAVPILLILRQPDLGTAILLGVGGVAMVFLAGISWRWIAGGFVLIVPVAIFAWVYVLADYQRSRVLTFLSPEADQQGAGWHILQSKIALGSGGIFGKGWMQGSQSQLDFLPEKHTDFIFTMFAEEFGLVGALTLLGLYLMVLGYGMSIALQTSSQFGRLVASGVCVTFLLYILINTSMVMGMVPVVGVPLPLVSYGGTSMMTLMFGFGLLMSVHVHRNVEVPRQIGPFL